MGYQTSSVCLSYIRLCTVMADVKIDIKRMRYDLQNQASCLAPLQPELNLILRAEHRISLTQLQGGHLFILNAD